MAVSNFVVKLTAKNALKNNWLNAIITTLIVIFSYFISILSVSYLSYLVGDIIAYLILAILILFLLAPLFLGLINYFWRMIFEASDSPLIVFKFFSSKELYLRAIKLITSLTVRTLLVGIILFIPAIIVDVFSGTRIYDFFNISTPLWTENLFLLSEILKLLAIVVLVFIMSKFHLAPFLMVADENMHFAEALHMSTMISRVTLLDFLSLIFSFFGWLLLTVFIFPLIFVLPYLITSLCVYTRFVIAEHNKKADLSENSTLPTFSVEF